jgi:guanyl-specific ribonuclease Sa
MGRRQRGCVSGEIRVFGPSPRKPLKTGSRSRRPRHVREPQRRNPAAASCLSRAQSRLPNRAGIHDFVMAITAGKGFAWHRPGADGVTVGPMERFVRHENIKRYRKLLLETTDNAERRLIQKLLTAEEQKKSRQTPHCPCSPPMRCARTPVRDFLLCAKRFVRWWQAHALPSELWSRQ